VTNVFNINPKAAADQDQKERDQKVLGMARELVQYFLDNKQGDMTLEQETRYLGYCMSTFTIAAKILEVMIKTGPVEPAPTKH